MSSSKFDPDSITMDEARDALADPEKGSLSILKILGKCRDQYTQELARGAHVLEVHNDLEQVAAEAALKDYVAELVADDEPAPKVSILRPRPAFK